MSAPRRKRFYPYFFGVKFYMAAGFSWGYLPCGNRLRLIALILFLFRSTSLPHRSRVRCARFFIGSLQFMAARKQPDHGFARNI